MDLNRIIDKIGSGRENLIPILRRIQAEAGYLPEKVLLELAEITDIPASDIASVATFYAEFRTRPTGRHVIGVCVGTACHVKGAPEILRAFKSFLKIPENDDTDPEMLFTIEEVPCLGCCMMAPAVKIDDLTYGNLTAAGVPGVIRDFLNEKRNVLDTRRKRASADAKVEVRLCLCSSCRAAGSAKVADELERTIEEFDLSAELKEVGCTGRSFAAPIVEFRLSEDERFTYGSVSPDAARTALLRHLRPTTPSARISTAAFTLLDSLLGGKKDEPAPIRYLSGALEGNSSAVVTENAGKHIPLSLDDYIEAGGFSLLTPDGRSFSPERALEELERSGLRGRGGAGFPVAEKWRVAKNAPGSPKYLICNGDEGDPGAFMDRMILESYPFKVVEGMILGMLTIGADEGLIYVRAEYPMAAENARRAVRACESRGLLGPNACGTERTLSIRVVEGAGAFVCGEETALIAALEGKRGAPSPRPPYPAERGFRGKPTLVNNVETLASIPWIFAKGPARFAEMGTERSRGVKTFALAGKIRRGGLIEVPMGTTLREIVYDFGGGVQNDAKPKAVLIGGPSGACVPETLFDTPIDYESLTELGGMMGSGGLVVLDETDCVVDIARYFLSFIQNESCGKCVFCRVGTKRMLEILEDLCAGRAEKGDIDELLDLGGKIKTGSACGLGTSAPNPVLTAIRYFRDEFEAHAEGACPAGVCKELTRYFITTDCIGCTICAQNCPVDAITSIPREKHVIDPDVCVRCGACMSNCPTGSVRKR